TASRPDLARSCARRRHALCRDALQGALHAHEVGACLREGSAAAAEHGRGMERRDQHAGLPERELAPAQLGDPVLRLEQQLGGEVAERDDDRGVDEAQLPFEVGPARLDLVGQRIAVPGRAALHHVGDVHLVAAQADVGDEPRQETARPADERDALLVLLGARALTDEHEVGARVAVAEHHLAAALGGEGALRAAEGLPLELLERGERGLHQKRHARWYVSVGRPRQATASRIASTTALPTATRRRSKWAPAAPVATTKETSPSKRVCDGYSVRLIAWWAVWATRWHSSFVRRASVATTTSVVCSPSTNGRGSGNGGASGGAVEP